ncbi:hypothetical protein WJX84_004258 [Apatococcus fuscideae]|uniref:RING-type domain-containing protein n=1 Tax=Apatococcus fuscideae TaxID=2026836 RepID=A0AAW1T7Y1_9CHLO
MPKAALHHPASRSLAAAISSAQPHAVREAMRAAVSTLSSTLSEPDSKEIREQMMEARTWLQQNDNQAHHQAAPSSSRQQQPPAGHPRPPPAAAPAATAGTAHLGGQPQTAGRPTMDPSSSAPFPPFFPLAAAAATGGPAPTSGRVAASSPALQLPGSTPMPAAAESNPFAAMGSHPQQMGVMPAVSPFGAWPSGLPPPAPPAAAGQTPNAPGSLPAQSRAPTSQPGAASATFNPFLASNPFLPPVVPSRATAEFAGRASPAHRQPGGKTSGSSTPDQAEDDVCIVCLDHARNAYFGPCTCRVTCFPCALKVAAKYQTCPWLAGGRTDAEFNIDIILGYSERSLQKTPSLSYSRHECHLVSARKLH